MPVTYPNLQETFKRTIYGFLSDYFDGGTDIICGNAYEFPDAKVVTDVRRLAAPRPTPVIAVVGYTTLGDLVRYKCVDPAGTNPFSYAFRCNILASMIIAAPTDQKTFSKRTVDRIWDLLFLLFTSQCTTLNSLGLFNVQFPCAGVEDPDAEYAVLSNTFTVQLRGNICCE